MLEGKELEELKRKYASQMAMTSEERAAATEWFLEMMGEPTAETLAALAEFDAKRKAAKTTKIEKDHNVVEPC